MSVGVGCVEIVVDQGLRRRNKQEIGLPKMLELISRIDSILQMQEVPGIVKGHGR